MSGKRGAGGRGVGGRRNAPSRRPAILAAIAAVLLASAAPAAAQARLTQQEALRLAFPGAEVERRTAYLTPAQVEAVRERTGPGAVPPPAVVTYYAARRDGVPAGTAWFDAHRVRTLAEVLMVVVSPEGKVQRVEVLRFDEPPDYRPPPGWLGLLAGQGLPGPALRRGVPPLSGATLTAEAVTQAARRSLALHAVLAEGAGR